MHTVQCDFVVHSKSMQRAPQPCDASDRHTRECFPFFTGEWEGNANTVPSLLLFLESSTYKQGMTSDRGRQNSLSSLTTKASGLEGGS